MPRAEAAGIAAVRLYADASVDGPYVELGEIAQIDAPGELGEVLTSLRVGIVPPFGVEIQIRKSDIEARIDRERSITDEFAVTGASSVTVRRGGVSISPADLESKLVSFLSENYGGRVEIVWKERFKEITVNRGEVAVEAKPPSHRKGALPQSLSISVDGKLVKVVALSRYLEFRAPVVIAREPVARGNTIPASALLVEIRTVPAGRAVILDVEDCAGLEAVRSIGAGGEISPDAVRKPFDVRRGDAVTVVVVMDTLTIETESTATQDGYIGDTIAVRLADGGKVMRGVVESPARVVVTLEGR